MWKILRDKYMVIASVVDLDYLSHVYVTTLFIRHFDIKKKKGTCIQKIMLCELHGSG